MTEPLNYLVPDPNNPGAMMPRYPVDSTQRATPGSSAHAYIDYLEGCLAQVREHMEQTNERLRGMEVLFDRRTTEFEARLDNAAQRIDGLETSLGPKAPY